MQQGCPQPHEEVPSALETLLLESASYLVGEVTQVPFPVSIAKLIELIIMCTSRR
jgi:hypothetical protein